MTASTLTFKIQDIIDLNLKSDIMVVCDGVGDIYQKKVSEIPPLGEKQVKIRYCPGTPPMVNLNELPGYYEIRLSCLDNTRNYRAIVFELAHEFGHVYLFPHELDRIYKSNEEKREYAQISTWYNWFVESCCIAMAYICLDDIAQKWIGEPPYPNWSLYAPEFVRLREYKICEALLALKIPSREKVTNWIQSELPRLAKECKTSDRPEQEACAIAIERILKEYPDAWGALSYLGDAIENGRTDFDRWSELATPEQRPLVKALDQVFNYRMPG